MALLRDALRPNLVQTCEGTPAIVHAGPFANIAHGNSSVLADLTAIQLADFVVTESGFGSDCGAEKLFNIKCRSSGLRPNVEVVVCTVRALKYHCGKFPMKPGESIPPELLVENLEDLRTGAVNLQAHLAALHKSGIPIVVALNRFPADTDREIDLVRQLSMDYGAKAFAVADSFKNGSKGTMELAHAVEKACEEPGRFDFLYPLDMPVADKLETIVREVYGGDGIDLLPLAKRRIEQFERWGFRNLPVCIAKTQYSLSHDPKLLGRPRGFRLPIRDCRLAAGAGYLYAMAGDISTLPGLPREPAALRIDVKDDGTIVGM